MKVEEKRTVVEGLAGTLQAARTVILTDFTGLSVKKMTELRARLRGAGVRYVVVKNTMAQRAFDGLDVPDVARFFNGPTGLVIEVDPDLNGVRLLEEFAREHENRPRVKVGVIERREYSAAEVVRLARLPSREQLLAELVGVLEAPLAQLVTVMGGLLGETAGLLDALRAERERT